MVKTKTSNNHPSKEPAVESDRFSLSNDTTPDANGAENEHAAPDPFDLNALKAPSNFIKTGGVKRTQLKLKAGTRAPKDKFIRVHEFDAATGDWCLVTALFECQFEGDLSAETFILKPGTEAYEALLDKARPALIVAGIMRGGSKFLWELLLPTSNGNRMANSWAETRLTVAKAAQTEWLKVVADTGAGGYCYETPLNASAFSAPPWGDTEFEEMIRIAYSQRIIATLDHPAVKERLGG